MNIIEYFKENQEKFISLFGFTMIFMLGFFSGYYYLLDQTDKREIAIAEPSAACTELFRNAAGSRSTTEVVQDNTVAKEEKTVKLYVASKNSKVFHKTGCSFAAKIKEENKIWFSSVKEAELKGFKPHSCVNDQ